MTESVPVTEKRKQTRRAVSLTRKSYDRIKEYGARNNRSLSGILEEVINKYLDEAPVIEPAKLSEAEPSPMSVLATSEVPKKVVEFKKGDLVLHQHHKTEVVGGPYKDFDRVKKTVRVSYRIRGVPGMVLAGTLKAVG